MKNITRNFIAISLVMIIAFSVSSCYRKKDTIAKVTVLDTNNSPVGGAIVTLTYAAGADSLREGLTQEAETDASGLATFNYNDLYKSGQAGFAVLDIYVDAVVTGIIKIEEETTSEKTVIVL